MEHALAQWLVRYVEHALLAPGALPPGVTPALVPATFLDTGTATLARISFAGFLLLLARESYVTAFAMALVTSFGQFAGTKYARFQVALRDCAEKT